MFFKVSFMEFKKSLLRLNTIAVLLIIFSISFISTINCKNGIEMGTYKTRIDKIITKKQYERNMLIDKLNKTNNATERVKIKNEIDNLNIDKLSKDILKSPYQVINRSVFNLLYISIIMGILFGDIFSKEYTTNSESLIFSSKVSRKSIVLSKLISSFVIIILVNSIFYLLCYSMGSLYLKDSSLNIPMQQLAGLENVKSNMTVIQYTFIGFLYLNLVCFLLVSLIHLVSSLTKNYILPVSSCIMLGMLTMLSANMWKDYSYVLKFIPSSYLSYPLFVRLQSTYNIHWYFPLIFLGFSTVIFITLTKFRINKKQVC